MQFATLFLTLTTAAIGVIGIPTAEDITKRETAYGNPDLVVDQGDRWKLNFGSTGGHPNACPGHCLSYNSTTVPYINHSRLIDICYIPKDGERHGDESWGNPDDMVDEGDRWRFNYGTANNNPCGNHYICYYNK
ncbi:hypothetical protein VNI00_008184 [Paramarasmius palmivorus]|uniref:Uncharacterized protein n=1 Tax=Paramarasmius palmivorus TaxID=297713 RepID=A0AAW0D120_9AGAR